MRENRCKAFVWNRDEQTCDLMKDMKKLEFDEKRRKWVGTKDCLGCERNGWDYGSDIKDVLYVDSHEKCSQICFYSHRCKASSYGLRTSVCYLINNDSERMMGSAPRWITTKKDGTVFVVWILMYLQRRSPVLPLTYPYQYSLGQEVRYHEIL